MSYSAKSMAPVQLASHCTCTKPDCVFRSGFLAPFRNHIARLHHVLSFTHFPGQLRDTPEYSWSAVTYHLQMAASLESLEADTSYVDLIGSTLMCSTAARYEAEHSRLASQYAAALVLFNFIWAAYEAAIKVGAASFLPKEQTSFRGRELMVQQRTIAQQLPLLQQLIEDSEGYALHVGDLERERAKIALFTDGTLERGAEMARLFRNHIAHGSDAPPVLDQNHVHCRTIRFYKLTRLILLLIQVIAIQALDPPHAFYDGGRHDDEPGCAGRSTRDMLANLHVDVWLV